MLINSIKKWRIKFKKKNLYSDISDILHLAICSFMKILLEATAETIGSLINNHSCKNRSSLLLKSLSNEVQVNWNGPNEEATSIIEEALESHFDGKETGMRFGAPTRLHLMSSTIAACINKSSRIKLNS